MHPGRVAQDSVAFLVMAGSKLQMLPLLNWQYVKLTQKLHGTQINIVKPNSIINYNQPLWKSPTKYSILCFNQQISLNEIKVTCHARITS